MKKLKAPNSVSIALVALSVCAAILFESCKGGQKAEVKEERLPNMKTEQLLGALAENQLDCDWLSIKYEVEIKTSKMDDSFKAYARIKKDSAIWISATYYSVEIARFLLTPDSVKYMDRRNRKYYEGDYSYLSSLIMFETNFNLVQNIILANSSALISLDDKVKSSKDDGKYLLSFLRKGQLRRAKRKEELNKELELVVSLWVDPKSYRVSKTSLVDFEANRTLEVDYSNFEESCNSSYPHTTKFVANSENEQAEVKTSVIKLSADKEVSLSFTIPEKYEPLVP